MKKNHFITLLIWVVGGLIFSLGMCMCLLPEWNALSEGKIVAAVGLVLLLALGIVGFAKKAKNGVSVNGKVVGKIIYGILAALVMGVGMCMIIVWQIMIPGIIVGGVGLVMLIFLIPMCLGLKK